MPLVLEYSSTGSKKANIESSRMLLLREEYYYSSVQSTCATLEIGGLLRSGADSQMTGASHMTGPPISRDLQSQEWGGLEIGGHFRVLNGPQVQCRRTVALY